MKKNIEALQPSTYYHIYNRGINSGTIFKEARNYTYFLKLYGKYIPIVADTFAYCLLGNHFHFLIQTKSETEILNAKSILNPTNIKSASFQISNQFSKLFNSYAQAYNKMYKRTGALFEDPFRRIAVNDERYFTELIYYIHANPKRHGICSDFTQYLHSSYNAFILQKDTQIKRADVLDWFGNKEQFIKFHQTYKYTNVLNFDGIE